MQSDPYCKLFNSIITSSIWSEDDPTRIVWITLLAIKDMDGFCETSIPGLAALARKSIDETSAAIKKLESPDTFSRSSEHEGRRIQKVEGGFIVLNHANYRDRERREKRREYMRKLMSDKRASVGKANKVLTNANSSVSVSVSESSLRIKDSETDAHFWSEMTKTYSWINTQQERAKMEAWLSINPGRKLTRRFVVNWFNKSRADQPLKEFKAMPSPTLVHNRYLNEIVTECLKRDPSERQAYLEGCGDKYKDVPKLKDKTVLSAACEYLRYKKAI